MPWQRTPGCSSPPNRHKKAYGNSDTDKICVTETLFAEDTTLPGVVPEIDAARNTTVETLAQFKEKCHPDKEEHL